MNKAKFLLILPVITLFSAKIFAVTCFFTVVKDSCWVNYDVNVNVVNALNKKNMTSVTVPKGKSWERVTFDCNPSESFNYVATFSPVFWASDTGKKFAGKRTWTLPSALSPNDTAWSINVCYPSEFTAVPLPPDATSNCKCDTKGIPAVVPPLSKT